MWAPRPIFGSWTADQERVAACFPHHRRVVVPAANGVGKTYLAADLVVSFILDMPAAAVILTAPTNRQVSELLWPHVTQRLLHSGLADAEWLIPTKPKWKGGDADSLIGFATNTPQRMQGFHAEHLIIICDEASGMPATLIEALEGIANAQENYILAIGNPNNPTGAFYNMTRQASYHVETISALTHPNIVERREAIPGATSWTALVDRIRDWCKETPEPTPESFSLAISDYELCGGNTLGADPTPQAYTRRLAHFIPNDAFRVRYLGRFPSAVAWSLIPRDEIQRAVDVTLSSEGNRSAALDIARTGGDKTIYGLRQGDTLISMREIPPSDLMTQAQTVAAIILEDHPSQITCDAAGLGIGLIDRLRQICNIPVIAFQGAAQPVSPHAAKKWFNRRANGYGNLQLAFQENRISIPHDQELTDELAVILYRYTDDGRMIVEDKTEIKKVLGRSPDKADMLSLLWESGTEFAWGGSPAVSHVEEVFKW